MSISKNSKLLAVLNYRIRITTADGRLLVGQMLAFDKHMNLVLAECEEFRKIKQKGKGGPAPDREEKRTLGLVVLRGEIIVSMSVESGPPPSDEQKAKAAMAIGAGYGKPAGRGLPIGMGGPAGLTGPVTGVGGPAASMMAPGGRGIAAPPVSYGRPPIPGPGSIPPPMMPGFGRGMPPPPAGFRPPSGMPVPPPGFRPPMPGNILPGMPPPG
ncbi:hypothetical protein HK096_009119, partial [Nowakowskiella sp. JEL0078]